MALPAPFFSESAGQLYNYDCVDGMLSLPESICDGLFTSPPYGVGKEYESEQSFGQYLKLLADFTRAAYHCIKPGGYMIINYADYYMFDGVNTKIQPMTYLYHIIAERVGWNHYCDRIWQKDYASLTDPYTIAHLLPKLEYEHISTFIKPGSDKKEIVREQTLHPRAIWSTVGIKQAKSTLKDHTAAFPEALVQMALKVHADPGQLWVEPFCGSGTTPYVCKKMGIKYVAFELSSKHAETSKKRLQQMVMDFDGTLGEEKQSTIDEVLQDQYIENGNKPSVKIEMPEDF
ncbi:MAG: site-specific DNA-methyltransferase [Candidatus Omnitrophota bacterium]